MEWQFRINWQALVEEAKQRRKQQKLTQAKLASLAGVSTPTVSRFENGEMDIQMSSVLSLLKVLGMTDQRMLVFPSPAEFYDPMRMVVSFSGKDGDRNILCAISREALDDHFGGDNKDLMKVFIVNRNRIEHEARRKYLADELEIDGSVLVKTEDIET
jgi:transcriptional regulator with XRE-family HTH domain